MSLIIDLLRKVGDKEKAQGVPPSITAGAGTGEAKGRRWVILILLFVAVLFGAGSYFGITLFLEKRLAQERIESEFLALKERVRASRSSVPVVSEEEEEVQTTEVDDEPSVMEATQPATTPVQEGELAQDNEPMKSQTEVNHPAPEKNPKQEATVPPRELQQAKMSKLNEEEELEKVVGDIMPEQQPSGVMRGAEPSDRTAEAIYANSVFYGDMYFKKGNFLKSMKYYERAYSINRDHKVANNLVLIYVRLGLLDKARTIIDRTKNERLVYTYLMEMTRISGTKKALEEGKELVRYDRHGYAHFALGYIYDLMGDHKQALLHYSKAYAKDPSNTFFAYNYARMLEATGDLRKAYVVYRGIYREATDKKLKETAGQRLRLLRSLGVSDEKG